MSAKVPKADIGAPLRWQTELLGQSGQAQGSGKLFPNAFVLHLHPRVQARNREMRLNFAQFPHGLPSAFYLSQAG